MGQITKVEIDTVAVQGHQDFKLSLLDGVVHDRAAAMIGGHPVGLHLFEQILDNLDIPSSGCVEKRCAALWGTPLDICSALVN